MAVVGGLLRWVGILDRDRRLVLPECVAGAPEPPAFVGIVGGGHRLFEAPALTQSLLGPPPAHRCQDHAIPLDRTPDQKGWRVRAEVHGHLVGEFHEPNWARLDRLGLDKRKQFS